MKKAIGILMVINNYPPVVGGAEIYAGNLAERLVKAGNDVFVVTRKCSGAPRRERLRGVDVARIDTTDIPGIRFLVHTVMVFLFAIGNRKRIDVIHAYHTFSTGFLACVLGWVLGKPVVIRDGQSLSSIEMYLKNRLFRALIRYTMKRSRIYVDNVDLYRLFKTFYGNARIEIIHNPVDSRKFRPPRPGENCQLSKSLGTENMFVIGYVGRLIEFKGLVFLVHAMKEVNRKIENSRLLLVGDGPEREKIENIARSMGIEKNIILAGKADFSEIHKFYQLMDVFVQPSLTPETPNTTVQAMSSGIPIVATDMVISDVLKNGENALIVKPKNPEEIAGCIIKLHQNAALRKSIGPNARKYAYNNLTWDSHAKRIVKIYQEIMDS